MTDTIHLLVRIDETGHNFYVTSPQAPGLVFSRQSMREVRAELQEVLEFYFDRPGPFPVVEHHERHFEVAGRELVTRIAVDEHVDERQVVFERIGAALAVPEQRRGLVDAPTNKVGEVVYVCAVASDTVGWLSEQLDPRGGDAFMVTAAVSDQMLFAVALIKGDGEGVPDRIDAADDETVADVIRQVAVVGPSSSAHPAIHVAV